MSTFIAPWYARPHLASAISEVAVIGGGLAGISLAYQLTQRNIHVRVLDSAMALPTGASSNQVALIRPQLSPDNNLLDQYYTAAFSYFLQFISVYPELILSQGILELSHSEKMHKRHQHILAKREYTQFARYLTAAQASALSYLPLQHDALYLHSAFLLDVSHYYQMLTRLCGHRLTLMTDCRIEALTRIDPHWHISYQECQQQTYKKLQVDAVIFANGHQGFADFIDTTTLIPCPGQLSLMQPARPIPLKHTLSFERYLTPCLHERHILGASFRHHNDIEVNTNDHVQSLNYLKKIVSELYQPLSLAPVQFWCAMRTTSLDHLPLIGAVPTKAAWMHDYARIRYGDFRTRQYPVCTYYPNLFMSLAHGSKGVLSSFYAAKIIADLLTNPKPTINAQLWQALHPARFWLRWLKKIN